MQLGRLQFALRTQYFGIVGAQECGIRRALDRLADKRRGFVDAAALMAQEAEVMQGVNVLGRALEVPAQALFGFADAPGLDKLDGLIDHCGNIALPGA